MAEAVTKIITPEGRLMWAWLFEPRKPKPGKDPMYQCDIVFGPAAMATPEFAALKALAQSVAIAKFGDKLQGMIAGDKFISPFWKNERKVDDAGKLLPGYEAGGCYITLKTKSAPGIRILKDGILQPVMNEQDIYAGCWVRASVDAYAFDNESKGVNLGLQNILKVRDDTPLGSGGRSKAEDDFGAFATAPAGAASGTVTGTAGALF